MSKIYTITSLVKEKSIVTINLDSGKNITVNMATGEICSVSGKEVSFIGISLNTQNLNNNYKHFIRLISDRSVWSRRKKLINLEPFFCFLENDDINIDTYNLPDCCPKGYINWCKEKNETISIHSLDKFNTEKRLKNIPSIYEPIVTAIKKGTSCFTVFPYLLDNRDYLITLCKVFNTSLKNIEDICNIGSCCYDFLREVSIIGASFNRYTAGKKELWNMVDTNRDFIHNISSISAFKNKIRNDKIIANENKFRAIEKLSNENITIVVPEKIEQFTDEGRQQNNCVGSYYHNNMENGTDFIYFLRHTDKPEKSWVTCRYNMNRHASVECRIKNNYAIEDNTAIAMIKEIDKIINLIRINNDI